MQNDDGIMESGQTGFAYLFLCNSQSCLNHSSVLDFVASTLHFPLDLKPTKKAIIESLHQRISVSLPCLCEVQRIGDALCHTGGGNTHGKLGGDTAVTLPQNGKLANVLLLVELLATLAACSWHAVVLRVWTVSLGHQLRRRRPRALHPE